MDTIKLTWDIDLGIEGEDTTASNPLSRSLNRLFKDGQPFKRLNLCFWASTPASQGLKHYKLWWFGAFVLSQGDRIIFFPGLTKTTEHIELYKGRHLQWDKKFNVDHFSLEKDHTRWHITSQNSKKHLGSLQTADLGEGRRLWFGMSISDFFPLWPLSKKTSIVTSYPPSDVDRRMKIIDKARKGAKFQIVEFHPDANKKNIKSSFSHVSVIIGPTGFKTYKGENHCIPFSSPFLTKPLPKQFSKIPIRYHRVCLSKDVDIQITTFKIPGAFRVPVTFTSMGSLTVSGPTNQGNGLSKLLRLLGIFRKCKGSRS